MVFFITSFYSVIIFIVQLSLLFLLARSFSRNFYRFWLLLTKSRKWAIRLSSFFLLPGTLIHELSHWLMAEILQVKTGKISLWPKIPTDGEDEKNIKLGSVQIAKTDPFRRTLIGLAPLVVGLCIIGLAVQFLSEDIFACRNTSCLYPTFLVVLVIFLVSNTMFSSKKDMEAAFVPLCFFILTGSAWWYFEWSLPDYLTIFFTDLLNRLNAVFVITIVITLIFLLVVKMLVFLFGKILRRRIVENVA